MAGYPAFRYGFPPRFAQVIHRLPGVTWRNAELPASVESIFTGFPNSISRIHWGTLGDYPVDFGWSFSAGPVPDHRRVAHDVRR
jgi:hypothetical protein